VQPVDGGCAIWCRVSKTEQEMANQLDELRQWAQRKGFEITREYAFEVSASNGSTRHREMLGQALSDARLGRFELMLVWALDRVSRRASRPRWPSCAGSPAMAPRCGRSRNRGPRRPTRGWPSCSRRCTRGWPPRSPAAAPNGPGPDSSAVNAKACRSAGSPARPIRSRASAAATLPAGNGNELRRGDASPCRFASCGLKIRRPV
jgi:Resolvase, N terminal domain